jgi:hypothetical protein
VSQSQYRPVGTRHASPGLLLAALVGSRLATAATPDPRLEWLPRQELRSWQHLHHAAFLNPVFERERIAPRGP